MFGPITPGSGPGTPAECRLSVGEVRNGDADDERVQIRAAEAILDRAGLTKAKMQSSATKAQMQIGGGERSGRGINRTDPLEDGDGDDPAATF